MPLKRDGKWCDRCGKRNYFSPEHAIHVILNRTLNGAPPLRWYQCPHSTRHVHITKKRYA